MLFVFEFRVYIESYYNGLYPPSPLQKGELDTDNFLKKDIKN